MAQLWFLLENREEKFILFGEKFKFYSINRFKLNYFIIIVTNFELSFLQS